MTWKWDQSAGELSRDGKFICRGYAGHDWGKNNPDAEAVAGVGPVPAGEWTIGAPYTSQNTGPFSLPLLPLRVPDEHGRGAFRIHGDSISHPGQASHGCIILARVIRAAIWDSSDHTLEVVH